MMFGLSFSLLKHFRLKIQFLHPKKSISHPRNIFVEILFLPKTSECSFRNLMNLSSQQDHRPHSHLITILLNAV